MFKLKITEVKLDAEFAKIHWIAQYRGSEIKGRTMVDFYDLSLCSKENLEKMIFEKIYRAIKEKYDWEAKKKALAKLEGKEFDEKHQLVAELLKKK